MSADEGTTVTETSAAPTPAAVATVVETPAATSATATTTTTPRRTRPGQPIQTVGRRKEAIVRVRLVPGTGKFTLNGREL